MENLTKVVEQIENCDSRNFALFACHYLGEEWLMDMIRDSLWLNISEYENLSIDEIKNKIGFVSEPKEEVI